MRRTQIYLTEAEDELLERESKRTGRSKAALIREAIDRMFGRAATTRPSLKRALDASFGTWRDLPGEELDRLRSLRGWSERQRRLLREAKDR